MDAAQLHRLFPALDNNIIYMNTASMALGCSPARQAHDRAVAQWTAGQFDFTGADQTAEELRALFAAMIGAQSGEVALVPFVSTAAGMVAAQLDTARPGENIVVADLEFSSNYFPWLMLKESGYEIRIVQSVDGMVPAEAYAAQANSGTRLIAVSAVQSATGFRADLPALSQIAGQSGAWLFVDAAQAAGAVSIDVRRDGIDFLAAPSHKFLLGMRGMGYLYVRHELLDQIRPIVPGWKAARHPLQSFYGPEMELSESASKLDTSLVWFPALAERESLAIFQQIGLETILDRNQELAGHLHEALAERGVSYKAFPDQNRSTIVSVPLNDPEMTMARLREASVVASVRAGRVRLSLHFYNDEDQIDRVAQLIAGS